MTNAMRAGVTAIAAVALGIGLAACSSDNSGEESGTEASATTSESAAPDQASPSPTPAAGPGKTLAQYIEESGLTETPVLRGDPGAPTITLPLPAGWEAAGPRAPQGAYDAIIYTADPTATTPPTIVAFVSKLTGDADPAKVIEYAPNETRNLPGFQGADKGEPSNLGGFDATQIGGFYTKDGINHMVAQKTVVIPGQDGLFVLKLTADGTEDLAYPLMEATAAIDEQTTITP
ncbi:envelope biogenesis lipoprotein LpqN [Mycobacterium sp. ZZG]